MELVGGNDPSAFKSLSQRSKNVRDSVKEGTLVCESCRLDF